MFKLELSRRLTDCIIILPSFNQLQNQYLYVPTLERLTQ